MNRPFTTWRNTGVNDSGATIVDREPHNRCRHCLNTGFVILDATGDAAPCPMCVLGGHRAVEWATGKLAPRSAGCSADQPPAASHTGSVVEHYWAGADFTTVSWNHGLTIQHDRCCSHHGCYRLVTRTGPCPTHDATTPQASFAIPALPGPRLLDHIEPDRHYEPTNDYQEDAAV